MELELLPIRPKKAERSITLEFVIVGRDHSDYNKRVKAFDALMDNGFVTIQFQNRKMMYTVCIVRENLLLIQGEKVVLSVRELKVHRI